MKTTHIIETEVPIDVMAEVADLLSEAELTNSITGSDEENNTITIEISYDSEDKAERKAIARIEKIIDQYEADSTQEN